MFFDDAKTASKELELTLTGKDCGMEERAPMCGVPFHSYETYAARLISKGYKVAICEQTEDPSKTKKLVKRDVIRVITPGTVMEQSMLEEGSNNYICSVFTQKGKTGMSFCDISTGELYATIIDAEDAEGAVKDELLKFSPKELLIGGDTVHFKTLAPFIKEPSLPLMAVHVLHEIRTHHFERIEHSHRHRVHFSRTVCDHMDFEHVSECGV